MLSNAQVRPSGDKFSFGSPTLISYQWSCDMFRISLTVFELFVQDRFDRYKDAPSGESIFIRKPDPEFLLVVC
jgi:hypothetical protein